MRTLEDIIEALEEAGIVFIEDDLDAGLGHGVRLARPPKLLFEAADD
jgi:hypothetical protein